MYWNLFKTFVPPVDEIWVEETISSIAAADCLSLLSSQYRSKAATGTGRFSSRQEARRSVSVNGSSQLGLDTRYSWDSAESMKEFVVAQD
jgi:thiazole synthase ThiGH ThiG subunit